MKLNNFKISPNLIRRIKQNAPTYTASENFGRRLGVFGDYEEDASGYKNICIYIQNGHEDKVDLFKEISKSIFTFQSTNTNKYKVFVFGFGETSSLQHEGKYYSFGLLNDSQNINLVARKFAEISGKRTPKQSIIPKLFPAGDIKSAKFGKTKIEKDDLLIIIGSKDEVFLHSELEQTVTNSFYKNLLFAEINNDTVNYNYRNFAFTFKEMSPMKTTNPVFNRIFDSALISALKKNKLFNDRLLPDIKEGNVFPAIRKHNIDFYYKGGRLFQYDKNGFKTNIKYASVLSDPNKSYLNEAELKKYKFDDTFYDNYPRIKENCANYSGVEAIGVSHLYQQYSYLLQEKDIVVLDTELSLVSLDEDKKSDRIDVLLYSKEKQELQLVEAKHYSNSEIWSTSTPKVINQIGKYQKQLSLKDSEILNAYIAYVNSVNNLFDISLPLPLKVNPHVILFIFGFDDDQKKGRLTALILKKKEYKGVYNYCKGDTKKMEIKPLWNAKPL